MSRLIDLVGKKFGYLRVLKRVSNSGKMPRWLCCCKHCGKQLVVHGCNLRTGHTRSCGFIAIEAIGALKRTHGMSGTPLYVVWINMIRRCENPKDQDYIYYGARGISVCKRWRDSSESFLRWSLTHGYADGLTLDRRNGNRGYSPANCHFTTRGWQSRNRRNNLILRWRGRSRVMSEWARIVGIPYRTLRYRIASGWRIADAMTMPVRVQVRRMVTS